jgi:ketosteroid isomerase-like protein
VSAENLAVVEFMREMAPDEWVSLLADEAALEGVRRHMDERLGDDFEVVLIGGVEIGGRGFDGLVGAFRDWLAPYLSYTFEWEGIAEGGDRVVALVRQVGVIATTGAPIEARSGVVFVFDAGRLVRMEFHFDRDDALRAAGLPTDA